MNFEDIAMQNLIDEIKSIDVLNLTPMDGFNKLYDIIRKLRIYKVKLIYRATVILTHIVNQSATVLRH